MQAALPLLLQDPEPLVLHLLQALEVSDVDAAHLRRLLVGLLDVCLQVVQQAVQAIQVPLECLAEHGDVVPQLGGARLPQDGAPAVVDLQQVDSSVFLLHLELVLGLEKGEESS